MSGGAAVRMVQLGPEHRTEILRLDQAAFALDPAEMDSADDLLAFEWPRTWGAVLPATGPTRPGPATSWEPGEELAGQLTTYSMQVTVPGAQERVRRTAMAGLSWVAVHPDHRRRGVLTAMMRHHLHGLHDSGAEAVAGLFASEAAIYQRFGYAEAAAGLALTLPTGAALRPLPAPAPVDASVTSDAVRTQLSGIGPDSELVDVVADLHDRCGTRPGRASRSMTMTRRILRDHPWLHRGGEPTQIIVARIGDRPTGYALLRRTPRWEGATPEGKVEVIELVGLDALTLHALWSRVLSFDLMSTVQSPTLGLDDPLLHWLVDIRSAQARREDGLWLRLVDVDRALMARGYATDLDLVIAIDDELCPWNARAWRLTASAASPPECVPTTAPADLSVPIAQLAATYLGGSSLSALHQAGLVIEHRAGAVGQLSRAMRGATEPAVPQMF